MDIGPVGDGVASAMVGGVASQLGGGKFENGAITSAFQYMYNACLDGRCFGSSWVPANVQQFIYDYAPGGKLGNCISQAAQGYGSCGEWLEAITYPVDVLAAVSGVGSAAKALTAVRALNSNPFVGKSAEEIQQMFLNKGFEPRGPDPLNGRGGYVNPQTGRSYHIDQNNRWGEASHIDVNRIGNSNIGDKAKYFLDGGRELK